MLFFWKKIRQPFLDVVFILAGSAVFAASVAMFAAPNEIVAGGFVGIATLLNYLFFTPIGSVTMLLNVPVILFAVFVIGYKIVLKSILALLSASAFMDLFAMWLPTYRGELILASVFAGVLEGIGIALIFLRSATTGGTVMISRLLSMKFPHVSMGKLLFISDFIVIAASGFVYQSLESVLYGLIVVFIATKVVDTIMYGMDIGVGNMMFIISEKNTEIAEKILHQKSRGVTVLYAKGAYSNRDKSVLFCAVRKFEMPQVRQIVRSIDANAFIVIGEAGQISGEGFHSEERRDATVKELLAKRKKQK